jgi:hypothetical protein
VAVKLVPIPDKTEMVVTIGDAAGRPVSRWRLLVANKNTVAAAVNIGHSLELFAIRAEQINPAGEPAGFSPLRDRLAASLASSDGDPPGAA